LRARKSIYSDPIDSYSDPIDSMADINAPLMEQVFDLPQRKWEAHIYHHGKADNLRLGLVLTPTGRLAFGD